jgi:hypothetical protein
MTGRSPTVPRVYDDFDDGDTRLDSAALVGGALCDPPRPPRWSGGTALMSAATDPRMAAAPGGGAGGALTRSARPDVATAWRPNVVESCVGVVAIVVGTVVLAVGVAALP